MSDLVAFGGAGWASIPVAFSKGDGTFRVTTESAPDFAAWAVNPGVKIVTGNFNADGLTDLAAFGGAGWASIPVAFSKGDGTWRVTNESAPVFAARAATPGVKIVTGDFNGDGLT